MTDVHRTSGVISGLLAVLASGMLAFAGTSREWMDSSLKQFEAGKADRVSIDQRGIIRLGRAKQPVSGISAMAVWSLAYSGKFGLVIGASSPAVVYRVAEGKATSLFNTKEGMVLSLLAAPDGGLYVGTATRGFIYLIAPTGDCRVFASLPETYVWSMAFDKAGNILAATGPNGKIYKITPQGKADVLFKTSQRNVLSLAVEKDGSVLAGTDTRGLLYRIDANGKATVLFDSGAEEVRSLVLDQKGNLYMCVYAGPPAQPKTTPSAGMEKIIVIIPGKGGGQSTSNSNSKPSPQRTSGSAPSSRSSSGQSKAPGPGGYVLVKTPEGDVRALAAFPGKQVFCAAPDGKGNVLVGTGSPARLYLINEDREGAVLMETGEAQITSMLDVPTLGLCLGTGNKANALVLTAARESAGTLQSKVFDAGYTANWGVVDWREVCPEGTKATVSTRTGNSAKPDQTWSPWSEELETPGSKMLSPAGRFLQYRMKLSTDNPKSTPEVSHVRLAFRTRNRSPHVVSLRLDNEDVSRATESRTGQSHSNSASKQRSGSSKTSGTPAERTISWQVADPDSDELTLALYFRAIDEGNWKLLKDDLKPNENLKWDTYRVPDNYYQLRLEVSDRPGNPAGEAKTADKVSVPFLLDNTRPRLVDLKSAPAAGGKFVLSGIAKDGFSPIDSIMYSIDAGEWKPIFPDDGIFDSSEEPFRITTEAISAGEHTVVFIATDRAGNTGSSKIDLQVKP